MLEIYIYGNSSVKIHPDNLVEEDSVFGHPAVQDVICVGAVDSGNLQKSIASYSSRGPVSIYYPEYELRNKIDLSGPGSVRVSGTNGKGSLFAGTSASAPSVAGIGGALVWSMCPEKTAVKYARSCVFQPKTLEIRVMIPFSGTALSIATQLIL